MYPNDLTEEPWAILAPYVVKPLPEVCGKGGAAEVGFSCRDQRYAVCAENRMPVADGAQRLSAQEGG